jgi:hypothetical protein
MFLYCREILHFEINTAGYISHSIADSVIFRNVLSKIYSNNDNNYMMHASSVIKCNRVRSQV